VAPRPVDQHDDSVAKADEVDEVQGEPRQPPGCTPDDPSPRELGDGRTPADRRHHAAVAVGEAGRRLARGPVEDLAGGMVTGLVGDLSDLREQSRRPVVLGSPR